MPTARPSISRTSSRCTAYLPRARRSPRAVSRCVVGPTPTAAASSSTSNQDSRSASALRTALLSCRVQGATPRQWQCHRGRPQRLHHAEVGVCGPADRRQMGVRCGRRLRNSAPDPRCEGCVGVRNKGDGEPRVPVAGRLLAGGGTRASSLLLSTPGAVPVGRVLAAHTQDLVGGGRR